MNVLLNWLNLFRKSGIGKLFPSRLNKGLLIFLLCTRKKKKFDGYVFFTYLIVYGAGRFWIEGVRTDQLKLWGTNMAVSQIIAGISVVVGSGLFLYYLKRHPLQNDK